MKPYLYELRTLFKKQGRRDGGMTFEKALLLIGLCERTVRRWLRPKPHATSGQVAGGSGSGEQDESGGTGNPAGGTGDPEPEEYKRLTFQFRAEVYSKLMHCIRTLGTEKAADVVAHALVAAEAEAEAEGEAA